MILSIYVPSIPCRKEYLDRLLAIVEPQVEARSTEVELFTHIDTDATMTIGAHRNYCIKHLTGKYITAIDDDDLVDPLYVSSILEAAKDDPDCITFRSTRYVNKDIIGTCRYSLDYEADMSFNFGPHREFRFERMPTHITPIRAELVLKTPFKDVNMGEDSDFAKRVRPLLKTEKHIPMALYTYLYRSNKYKEPNNANKYHG